MKSLRFNVAEQRLSRLDDNYLVAGTKGYLQAVFFLSNEWQDLQIAARFFDVNNDEYAVILKNGICTVPSEVTQGAYFKVCLLGEGDYTLSTNKVVVRQEVV